MHGHPDTPIMILFKVYLFNDELKIFYWVCRLGRIVDRKETNGLRDGERSQSMAHPADTTLLIWMGMTNSELL